MRSKTCKTCSNISGFLHSWHLVPKPRKCESCQRISCSFLKSFLPILPNVNLRLLDNKYMRVCSTVPLNLPTPRLVTTECIQTRARVYCRSTAVLRQCVTFFGLSTGVQGPWMSLRCSPFTADPSCGSGRILPFPYLDLCECRELRPTSLRNGLQSPLFTQPKHTIPCWCITRYKNERTPSGPGK